MNARDLPFPAKFRDALGGGIDYSLPGNGGPDCRDHVSFQHRMWETGAALGLAFLAILLSNRSSKQQARGERRGSSASRTQPPPPPSTSRRLLLVILTFTYGLEVGFKLATRQLIFLLNPCHVLTVINIYILSSGGGPMAQTLHLRTLHYLHGPILALLLPVTNTLFLPFEAETYWIQHILIVVVPIYLLVTNPEYRSQVKNNIIP